EADGVVLPNDTNELKQRLLERVQDKKVIPLAVPKRSAGWMRAAAMVIAIAGAGLLVYQFGFNNKQTDIAQVTSKETAAQDTAGTSQQAVPDTAKSISGEGVIQIAPEKIKDSPAATAAADNLAPAKQPVAAPAPPIEQELLQRRAPGAVVSKDDISNQAAVDSVKIGNGFITMDANNQEASENRFFKKKEEIAAAKATRSQSYLQSNIFRGKVMDSQNNPLPFANITNSRDNVGTYSDAQGNFVLTSPDSVMDVQVRSLGFQNNNVQLQNGATPNKIMLNDDRSLTAVVISNKKINSRLREGNLVLEETEPADGWNNYDTYLANNLNPPEQYKNKQAGGGEVELSFEVNQLGEPINIKVVKSLCEVCDKEAIRLLKDGPKWKRKAKKGRRTTVTIPF
ncbi:MAG: hypothetical protein EOP49_42835, partial [Sphingobacteriales bacterium]